MTFEVDVAGRTRIVSIERAGDAPGRFRVVLDGRSQLVDAVRIADFGLSLMVPATFLAGTGTGIAPDDPFSGQMPRSEPAPVAFSPQPAEEPMTVISREVQVTPAGRTGEVLVSLDGRVVEAMLNGRRAHRGAGDAGGLADGEQTVVAPMPGRVVRVLVAPGDEVAARQAVVVVEAMKMENELRSPKPGRVKDVTVTPGTAVEAGRVLVVIE